MAGRICSYIHSDNSTPGKAGCIVKLVCQTDFAAKTPEFKAFGDKVAMYSCGFGYTSVGGEGALSSLFEAVPALRDQYLDLTESLKEKVWIADIICLSLDQDDVARCDGSYDEVVARRNRLQDRVPPNRD